MVSLTEPELKALMLAGLGGDQAAHGRLLAALAPRLRAYFARRIRQNAADVEDLVQDTLLAIHLKRGMYDPTQPLTPWVLAIARYKLIDAWRRAGSRPTEPLGEDDDLPGPDDHEGAMARRDLDVLLDQLPPRQGALLRDVRIEGLSMAEAATRRGMSVAAVKVALHRSLKALQTRVGARSDGGDHEHG
jgi:RNA polymerase sigma-70 factor (ECF subfamily)